MSHLSSLALTDEDRKIAQHLLRKILNDHGPAEAGTEEEDPAILMARARMLLRRRTERARYFAPSMFGEPAWDMLLLLYVSEDGENGLLNARQLAAKVGAPATSGLRWIDYLFARGLVSRDRQQGDQRAIRVRLTDKARRALEAYLGDTAAWNG